MTRQRQKFSPEFKVRVVLELLTNEKRLLEASREYQIKASVISRWRQEFLERAPQDEIAPAILSWSQIYQSSLDRDKATNFFRPNQIDHVF
jgi:transposase-like protein